jgi:hypothetical protein
MTAYSVEIKRRTNPTSKQVRDGQTVFYMCWGDDQLIGSGFTGTEDAARSQAQAIVDAHAAGTLSGWTKKETVNLTPEQA